MYIHKNILVDINIDYYWSKKNKTPLKNTDFIVIHYTAGATAISSARYLCDKKTPVSAHLLISRNTKIYQMVDFQTQAWHAGKSQYYNLTNINQYSIGIELENYGQLKKKNDAFYTWFGKKVPPDEVILLPHPATGKESYWHRYPENQIMKLKEVCQHLLYHYNIRYIVGHNEISQSGKIDPGPAFPMDDTKRLIYQIRKL